MCTREDRIKIFEGTRELCYSNRQLTDSISNSISEQRIYWEEESIECPVAVNDKPFKTVLSPQKTLEAAKKYADSGERVCILNFASSVSPGGGVLTGEQAQEECISRLSTLWFALSDKETAGRFYDRHWELIKKGEMNRRNRDDIVFTPDIFVVRDEADNEKMMDADEWYKVDVITCAAPDIRKTGDVSEYCPPEEELQKVFEIRWRKILTVAAKHKADVLILGAFGCGVFANPPELVVRAFNNVAGEFRYHFKTVEFAVYTTDKESRNYKAFGNIKVN
ncbi:MAG: TIGR02452 family protein [Clostridia bacterium]|nr:TIGR02452 family protein [Clostridia bacterium]